MVWQSLILSIFSIIRIVKETFTRGRLFEKKSCLKKERKDRKRNIDCIHKRAPSAQQAHLCNRSASLDIGRDFLGSDLPRLIIPLVFLVLIYIPQVIFWTHSSYRFLYLKGGVLQWEGETDGQRERQGERERNLWSAGTLSRWAQWLEMNRSTARSSKWVQGPNTWAISAAFSGPLVGSSTGPPKVKGSSLIHCANTSPHNFF